MNDQKPGIGAAFKTAFQEGMDRANAKRERTQAAKRLATERQLHAQEDRLRHVLRQLAEGRNTTTRDNLATEIEVWQALYDDVGSR